MYSHWNTGPHMTILLIIWLEDSTQLHFMNSTLYGYTDHIIWSLRTSNIHYWRTKYIITAWINERQCILVALWLFKRSSSHIQTVGLLFLKSVFLTEEYTAHFNIWLSLTIGNLLILRFRPEVSDSWITKQNPNKESNQENILIFHRFKKKKKLY